MELLTKLEKLRSRGKPLQVRDIHLEQKLAEVNLLLEVVAEVNSLMSKGEKFEAFCSALGKILKEKLGYTYIHIWMRDERDPSLLRLVTPETVGKFRTAHISHGIVGKTMRDGKTICAPNVYEDPDYVNIHQDTKSELCIPFRKEDTVIGALNIETDTYQTFDGQLAVLELIAENLTHSLSVALLYETREQFYRLVEHMSEGVWVGDSEEQTLYTNPALQNMVVYTVTEFLHLTSYDFFDAESIPILKRETAKRKHGIASHYEAIIVTKHGERIPVLIHGVPFGKAGGTMSTITDLRPVKSAEKKLERAENFLASIIQNSPEAIVACDPHAIVQTWNSGAEHMFGYRAEEMVEKSITILIHEDRSAEFDHIMQEVKRKGFIRNFETVRLHKNGTPIDVSITVSAILDEHGKMTALSGIYRDITAQKKWERELQDRFEKMQDAYREMGRQRRYLDYLTEVIEMAETPGIRLKQLATFIVNAMLMATKVNAVTFRMFDEKRGKLFLIAQSGLGEEWWTKKTITYKGSLVENAFREKHPLKILDIVSDPRYTSPALARKNNLRSALIIPLITQGILLGSLTLYISQENNLSLLDDEFITIFAKQAAIALKSAM